jgi:ABC-type Fe3+ transport system substrate-binding protein
MLRSVLAALALAGLCVSATAAEFSAELKDVIAAAKKEGQLNLMWGEGTLGGTRGAKEFERALNAMYGTDLKITFTPGQNMVSMGYDLVTRQAANQPSPTDVFIGYGDIISRIHPKAPFHPVAWAKLLPGRVTAEMVEADGTAVKLVTALPGIAYNSRLVPSKPTSMADFLKPEWKGKIASTPYAAMFDVMAGNDMWGPEKTLDFARKFSAQLAGLMRCNEGDRIASGEFLALAVTCSGTDFTETVKKGAPIVQVPPSDFATMGFFYLTVPKNAVNPNAAKLYTAFALTPEGQKLVFDNWNTDLHLFPGSSSGAKVADFSKTHGVTPKTVNIAWYMAHPEGYATSQEVVKILARK